jgi:hypothetical protein
MYLDIQFSEQRQRNEKDHHPQKSRMAAAAHIHSLQ